MARRTREVPSTTALGAAVRHARKARGLSLEQVGAALGLRNGNFVGMVERGLREPDDVRLRDWERTLGVPVAELLRLKHARDPASPLAQALRPAPRYPWLRRALEEAAPEFVPTLVLASWGPLEELAWAALAAALAPLAPLEPGAWDALGEALLVEVRSRQLRLSVDVAGARLRFRMGQGPWHCAREPEPPGLSTLLQAQGLDGREVEWVLDLVEVRRARRSRGGP
jgi:transcriptional regulator with XRE-family HTH domain